MANPGFISDEDMEVIDQMTNYYAPKPVGFISDEEMAAKEQASLPFAKQPSQLGADYDQSVGGNILKGVVDVPEAAYTMAGDAFNTLSPYNTEVGWQVPVASAMKRAGAERTLETVGGLGAGVAGAAALAPFGAGWGSAFGPIGTLAGGALAGGAGFAGGLMGFDFANDAASDIGSAATGRDLPGGIKPIGNYAKDFAYNTSQGAVMGAVQGAAFGGPGLPSKALPQGMVGPPTPPVAGFPGIVPAMARSRINPFSEASINAKVVKDLTAEVPDYANKIDAAYTAQAGDPFLFDKSLGELLDSPALKNKQDALSGSAEEGLGGYGRSAEARRARNDKQLKFLDQIETGIPEALAIDLHNTRSHISRLEGQLKNLTEAELNEPLGNGWTVKSSMEAQLEKSKVQLGELESKIPNSTTANVQSVIQQGAEADIATAQKGVDFAQGFAEVAANDLPPAIEPSVSGPGMRGLIQGAKQAMQKEATANFEAGQQGIVDPSIWQATIATERPNYFKRVGEKIAGSLDELIDELHRQGEPVTNKAGEPLLDNNKQPIIKQAPYTLEDTQALRSKALKIAQGTGRDAGLARKIAASIKEAEDAALQAGTATKEQLQSLNEGRNLRKEQGDLFQAPNLPGSQALKSGDYGNGYTVLDSQLPAKIFRSGKGKGGAEAIRNYKEITGYTEQAQNLLLGHISQDLYQYAWKDGKLVPGKVSKWLENNAESLSEVPELKQVLSNVKQADLLMQEKFGNLEQTQASFEKGALSQWLRGKDGVALDPQLAIEKMVADKTGANLRATYDYLGRKDPDAQAGLRRGLIDHLKKKVYEPNARVSLEEATLPNGPQFDGRVRDALLTSEWLKIKGVLENSKRKVFTESQMKGLDDLYRDKSSQLSVSQARVTGSPTQPKMSVMNALLKKASSGYLSSIPKFGPYLAVVDKVLGAIPRARYLAKFEEALLNPRVARDLQNPATTKNVTKSVQAIFKDELTQALLPSPVVTSNQANDAPLPKKRAIPNQSQITSKKSFPTTQELTNPPTTGFKKTSLNLSNLAPETQARISVESGGDPAAVSRKGAQGLSQLMPATAQEIAGQLGETYMPLTAGMTAEQQQASIDQNIRFGDYYYKKQLKTFKKPTLAWAAYNAGPNRVKEAMAMAGSQTDVNKILASLPKGVQKETVPYVGKIMARLANG